MLFRSERVSSISFSELDLTSNRLPRNNHVDRRTGNVDPSRVVPAQPADGRRNSRQIGKLSKPKNLLGNLCDDNNNNITIASHHTIGLYNKLKGWKKIGKVIDGHCFLLFLFSSSNV